MWFVDEILIFVWLGSGQEAITCVNIEDANLLVYKLAAKTCGGLSTLVQ